MLVELAYGSGGIGGAPIHATLRPPRGFVEQPTVFIANDRVGEASGDVSRAAEALESIIPAGIALDQAQLGPEVTIGPWAVGPSECKPDTGSTRALPVLSLLWCPP